MASSGCDALAKTEGGWSAGLFAGLAAPTQGNHGTESERFEERRRVGDLRFVDKRGASRIAQDALKPLVVGRVTAPPLCGNLKTAAA